MADELFVDTNVWLYASSPRSPWYAAASTTLGNARAAGASLVISPQIIREYLAAATRPGVLDPAPTLTDLLANAATLAGSCRVVDDTRAVSERLVNLLGAVPVAQRRVHDANLVATMITLVSSTCSPTTRGISSLTSTS